MTGHESEEKNRQGLDQIETLERGLPFLTVLQIVDHSLTEHTDFLGRERPFAAKSKVKKNCRDPETFDPVRAETTEAPPTLTAAAAAPLSPDSSDLGTNVAFPRIPATKTIDSGSVPEDRR
jgi:hypothetical protein